MKKTCASRCYTAVLTIKYLFCTFSSHSIDSKPDCQNSAVMLLQPVLQRTPESIFIIFPHSFWPESFFFNQICNSLMTAVSPKYQLFFSPFFLSFSLESGWQEIAVLGNAQNTQRAFVMVQSLSIWKSGILFYSLSETGHFFSVTFSR